jgi:asparagine synthase (glutamine-hydrolysing)
MCGIIGSSSNKFVFTREHIGCLSHRGPDGQGYFCENNVMLGHKRLAIVDLSSNGDQPMFSEDGNYVLIFNGEIYNHQDIRKELLERGYNFRSSSDTETLLYGFVEFGYDIVKKLNGIFAFAIYDKTNRKCLSPGISLASNPYTITA